MIRSRNGGPVPGPGLVGIGLVLVALGCGRKGPPLPPLLHRPTPAVDFQARQQGPVILLSFRLPRLNQDGSAAEISEIRVLRRPTRIEDTHPDRRSRLERHFSRGAEVIGSWKGTEMDALSVEPGRRVVVDPSGTDSSGPGFLLVYRVLLRGARTDGWTPSAFVFIRPKGGLLPPGRLRSGRMEEGSVLLEWDPPPVEPAAEPAAEPDEEAGAGYNLYRSEDSDPFPPGPLNPEPLEETRFVDPLPPPEGRTHRYLVRTVWGRPGALLESEGSNEVTVTTPRRGGPVPPRQITLAVNGAWIRLFWFPPPGDGVGGYRIYRREEGREEFDLLGEVPASEVTYTDGTALPGVLYWYGVSAFSSGDPVRESEVAGPVSGRVVPGMGETGEEVE